MVCCINPDCSNPQNPPQTRFCQNCGETIIPLLLNRFKVIKVLGRGGFGKTYLAEDTHKLNESCVVKQLAPKTQGTWARNKAIELFKQEAQQLQQLGEHHHIPSLCAYFEQNGYLYLVQQFIQGRNLLKELEERGVWQEAAIKNLLLELLPVLDFIHQQDIIHRDIKLENIMRRQAISIVEKSGNLVLIDFGVSKQLSETVMSKPGTAIGSPGYAPLEQMEGGEAYPTSDLYALGVTCFHLLSNIHPRSLWVEEGYGWTKNWHNYLRFPLSSTLEKILSKLLQKNREYRYQSAREVLTDLQTLVVTNPFSQKISSADSKKESQTLTPTEPFNISSPKSNPINQTQQNLRQNQAHNPLPVKIQLSKKFIASAVIVLVGFFGYKSLDSVLNSTQNTPQLTSTTKETSTPEVLEENVVLLATLAVNSGDIFSLAFSPDGKTLAGGGDNNIIKLWNLETKEAITTLTGNSRSVYSVTFNPDGQVLAGGGLGDTIKLWNVETKQEIATITGNSFAVESVEFTPDGKTLAIARRGNYAVEFWNVETRQEITALTGHSKNVYSLAFSPDGKILASGSHDKTIKLWDVEHKQEITTINAHSDAISSVAFSPDGQILASGAVDNKIKLWDVETKQEIATLTGHSDMVMSVAFSPDGKILASGSYDNTVKLWDVKTKQEITTLTGHSDDVESVAFSPDGKTLASGSRDDTIKLWRLP